MPSEGPKLTPEEKANLKKERMRNWYLKNQETLRQRAVERYYAKQEECKTQSRERARRNRAKYLELLASNQVVPPE